MNKDYFKKSEKDDYDKFLDFQELTHIFKGIERMKKGHHSDATGYTVNSMGEIRKFNIELKDRVLYLLDDGNISGCSSNGPYIDDTLVIESHKVADLLLDNMIGFEPLYVNFTLDGSTIIFNLNKLTRIPLKRYYKTIYSKGYERMEDGHRQHLYMIDAAVYDKEGNLIKKPGEEWKTQKDL